MMEIYEASEKAKEVVRQISTLSRKNVETVYKEISAAQMLRRAVKMVDSVCPPTVRLESGIDLTDQSILGNATQLHQVILNICVSAMGVMNLLPWGGPTMRAATVIGVEPNQLWMQILPMQVVGIVIAIATAFIWGNIEKRRGAGTEEMMAKAALEGKEGSGENRAKENDLARPDKFIFNLILSLVVILCLIFVKVPSYYVFMVGCVIALFINYPGAKKQNQIIKSHSGTALMMASTILSAGVFLGVMEQSDIMMNMANVLAGLIPQSMGRMLPIIIGLLAVPLTLLFDTDSFFFGLMPILISIAETFGIRPEHIAIVMVVCRNCATFISPVVPATFLGIGLAGVEIKDHIKRCFFWIWGVSIICMVSGLLLGVIKI